MKIVLKSSGKDITNIYDVSGLNGVNCESVVEWMLTGQVKEPKGSWLRLLVSTNIVDRNGMLLGAWDFGSSNSS